MVEQFCGHADIFLPSRSFHIAQLAELHQVRTGSHGATDLSPVCMGAALHFDTWVHNFGIQEYMGYHAETMDVFRCAWSYNDGFMHPGEAPGLVRAIVRLTGMPQFDSVENYALKHHLGQVWSQSWGATENTLFSKAGKKVFLILDNLGVHHCKPVKAWLAENTRHIEVFYLPSYSPELNPVERIWLYLRERPTGKEVRR